MTVNQMIQKIAKAIKNESQCVLITDGKYTENIYLCTFVCDEVHGRCIKVCYFDETEPSNPFNEGECIWIETWLGPKTIVELIQCLG